MAIYYPSIAAALSLARPMYYAFRRRCILACANARVIRLIHFWPESIGFAL